MDNGDRADESSRKPRRPYAAPAVEESGGFERLVLSCGHQPDDIGNEMCDPDAGGMPSS